MKLDSRTQAMIAVGASVAANCTGCLEKTVKIATELGLGEEEIGNAMELGKRVRAGAATKMDEFTQKVNAAATASSGTGKEGCFLHRILKPSCGCN